MRKLKFAYNPETNKWHLRMPEMNQDYIGDRESVKTFYEYESNLIGSIVHSKISDDILDKLQYDQEERYKQWRKEFPKDLFPFEKFHLFN